MSHKHHAHSQLLGFALMILLLGGALGGVSALMGEKIATYVDAVDREGESSLLQRLEKRHLRRAQRLKRAATTRIDVSKTYPMQTSALVLHNWSEKWEVALNTAFLTYPRLGIAAPIGKPSITRWENRDWRGLEDQMQFGLLHGVVAYPHSPPVGGAGTIVIAGHSSAPTLEALGSRYQDVFAPLPQGAAVGDRIELRGSDGTAAIYEVYGTEIIEPSETSILLQNEEKHELTLMTCYPIGMTKERFIVHAKLIEGGEKNLVYLR